MGSYFLSSNEERDSNQIKLKNELENVKSKYILQKIFFNLKMLDFLI